MGRGDLKNIFRQFFQLFNFFEEEQRFGGGGDIGFEKVHLSHPPLVGPVVWKEFPIHLSLKEPSILPGHLSLETPTLTFRKKNVWAHLSSKVS